MGLGKWVLGGVCAVGAVVAAPVVLPAAAVAGAAAAGAAATAGAAVAGAAATAGAAVAAAGTAAAGAVASTAVGTAVAGGMAAVGGTVGAAAGAAGLASVATVAGTTAGATAVGAITTSAVVGAAATGVGAKKMREAKELVEKAEKKYNKKKVVLDKEEKITNESLQNLGHLKIQVWQSFDEFYNVIQKIKNCKIIDVNAKEENLKISKEELDNLKAISFKASELLSASAGSIGAGALAGVAAYGGTMAIGTASTGATIASLSGVAATNATLAALGGGSLAAGGLGMAGGTAVLGGLVAAPALAVGGLFLAFKGNASIEKAYEVEKRVDHAIDQMNESIILIREIGSTVDYVYVELRQLSEIFNEKLNHLKKIIEDKQDFRTFTAEEIHITESCVLSVKILKALTTTNLLIKKGDKQFINKDEIMPILNKAKDFNQSIA